MTVVGVWRNFFWKYWLNRYVGKFVSATTKKYPDLESKAVHFRVYAENKVRERKDGTAIFLACV